MQFAVIHGSVTDEAGKALNGAQVVVQGTQLGATVSNGHFHIRRVPAGAWKVTAGRTGYDSRTATVEVSAGQEAEVSFTLPEATYSLDPLVVTGTRTVKKRTESPVQVNIVPAENFDIENAANVAEGLQFTPGVRVEANCNNCNFTQIRMNGLQGEYTQVLIDGRATVSSLAGVYGLEQLPSSMVEQLEIVKGGGSSLYGGSAVGGVVNIITARPQVEQVQATTRMGWIDGIPDRTMSFNATRLNDDHSLGAFVFGQRRERNPVDLNSDGFSELGMLEMTSFGGQLFWDPSQQWSLRAEMHGIQEDRRGGDRITHTQPHEAIIAEAVDTRRIGGSFQLDYIQSASLDHSYYFSFAHTTRDTYYGGSDYVDGQWVPNPDAYGTTENPLLLGGSQFNWRPNLQHTLSIGFEAQMDDLRDEIANYNIMTDKRYTSLGLFAQDDWQIGARTNAILGARIDKHSEIGAAIISPRASLMYKTGEYSSLRGTVSTGYRPPATFDEDLHITQIGGEGKVIENSDGLNEERSLSFNGGWEYTRSFSNQRGFFGSVGGFYTRLYDAFATEFDRIRGDAAVYERINAGGAEVFGIEFEATSRVTSWLEFDTGWTIQRSRYDEPVDLSTDESVEIPRREFMRTPEIYGYISSKLDLSSDAALNLSLDVTGPMSIHNEETNALREDTGWFGVFDTKLSYTLGGNRYAKVFIHGHNLFNSFQDDLERVVTTGGADEIYMRDAAYIYGPQRPRSFYTGVETSF